MHNSDTCMLMSGEMPISSSQMASSFSSLNWDPPSPEQADSYLLSVPITEIA